MIAVALPIEQALLATDPAYQAWSEARQQEDEAELDEWLMSQAGLAWLEEEEERAGSVWNHDGFSPAEE